MYRFIKLTFLTDVVSCILILILGTIRDSFVFGLYTGLLTFGNILLPTAGGVLIYKLIKDKTTLKTVLYTLIIQTVLLAAIFVLGLFIWAASEAVLYNTKVKEVYESEFSGFLPVVFAEAILIPSLGMILTRRKTTIRRVQA
jgi:hypothetical protein